MAAKCARNVPGGKRLLTYRQLVDEYGGTIWMWRSLVWNRELPFVPAGGGNKHLIDRQDVETYIEKNKRMA